MKTVVLRRTGDPVNKQFCMFCKKIRWITTYVSRTRWLQNKHDMKTKFFLRSITKNADMILPKHFISKEASECPSVSYTAILWANMKSPGKCLVWRRDHMYLAFMSQPVGIAKVNVIGNLLIHVAVFRWDDPKLSFQSSYAQYLYESIKATNEVKDWYPYLLGDQR